MKKKVNLKDIARHAGVSLGTASKVINNKYVKPDYRIRVESSMKELNYIPNAIARSLKIRSTRTIGVIISDISSPVASNIVAGIEKIGRISGYNLMLYDTKMSQTDEVDAIRIFTEKLVDGIIYTSNTVTDLIANKFLSIDIPVVFIATKYPNDKFSSVTIDNERAAYFAVNYLCQCGHTNISMLSGPFDDPNAGFPRITGFKNALNDNSIKINDMLIVPGDYRLKDGYKGMKEILRVDKNVTAVFCASDEMAIGAIRALNEEGYSVPDDVSVVGFDGIEIINYTNPTITSIKQPLYEFGIEGMKILLDKIDNKKSNINLVLDYTFIENESVKRIK